jgi:hypothetical protein
LLGRLHVFQGVLGAGEFRRPDSGGIGKFWKLTRKKWPEFPPVFDVPWDPGESEERNRGKEIGESEKCEVVIRKIV